MRKTKMIALTVITTALLLVCLAPVMAAEYGRVNINTANVDELMTLDQIGEAYAKRIVAYRQSNGSFQKPEDILMVKGIGPKVLEVNADRIVVKDE